MIQVLECRTANLGIMVDWIKRKTKEEETEEFRPQLKGMFTKAGTSSKGHQNHLTIWPTLQETFLRGHKKAGSA